MEQQPKDLEGLKEELATAIENLKEVDAKTKALADEACETERKKVDSAIAALNAELSDKLKKLDNEFGLVDGRFPATIKPRDQKSIDYCTQRWALESEYKDKIREIDMSHAPSDAANAVWRTLNGCDEVRAVQYLILRVRKMRADEEAAHKAALEAIAEKYGELEELIDSTR